MGYPKQINLFTENGGITLSIPFMGYLGNVGVGAGVGPDFQFPLWDTNVKQQPRTTNVS